MPDNNQSTPHREMSDLMLDFTGAFEKIIDKLDDGEKRSLVTNLIAKIDGVVPQEIVQTKDLKNVAKNLVTDRDVHENREREPFGTELYAHRDCSLPASENAWIGPREKLEAHPYYAEMMKVLNNGKPHSLQTEDKNHPVMGAKGKVLFYLPVGAEQIDSIRLGIEDEDRRPFTRRKMWIETSLGRTFEYDPEFPVDQQDVNAGRKKVLIARGNLTQNPGYKLWKEWDWDKKEWVGVPDQVEREKVVMGSYPEPGEKQFEEPESFVLGTRSGR